MTLVVILKIYSDINDSSVTTIAKYGYIDKTKFLLLDVKLSQQKKITKNNVVKFEQMNLDLGGIVQQQLNNLKFKKPQL